LLAIVFLAVAVSFDGFAAGFVYGVRRLEVPFISLLTVSLLSALSMALSIGVGKLICLMVDIGVASLLGGAILCIIGGWIVVEALAYKESGPVDEREEFSGEARFRYIRGVLREPVRADIDHSGSISCGEAMLLGIALAMDAFGAGIGAAMTGLPLLLTAATVGLIKFVLVKSGVCVGRRVAAGFSVKKASCVAGGILICLGVITFWP